MAWKWAKGASPGAFSARGRGSSMCRWRASGRRSRRGSGMLCWSRSWCGARQSPMRGGWRANWSVLPRHASCFWRTWHRVRKSLTLIRAFERDGSRLASEIAPEAALGYPDLFFAGTRPRSVADVSRLIEAALARADAAPVVSRMPSLRRFAGWCTIVTEARPRDARRRAPLRARSPTCDQRVFGSSNPAPFSTTFNSSVMSRFSMPANIACLNISRAA